MKLRRLVKLDQARVLWREIATDLERAPITDAEKLVAKIREDLKHWPQRATDENRD